MFGLIPTSLMTSAVALANTNTQDANNQYDSSYLDQYMNGDPEGTLAAITRDEYLKRLNTSDKFERDAVNKALTDTSLIDEAKESAARTPQLTRDIVRRNQERFGVSLTPAQQLAQQNRITQSTTLGGIGAVNQARLDQQEQNTTSLGRLLAAANNSYSQSMGLLGNASASAAQRKAAYEAAKAQSKANLITGIGGLVSKFI